MTTRHRSTLVLGLLAAAVTVVPARADVLFDTFEAGNSFGAFGSIVSGSNSGFTMFSQADRFTAAFSGSLSGIEVAVNLGLSGGNPAPTSAGFIDLALAPNNPATNLPLVTGALTLGTVQAISTTPAVLSLAPSTPYVFTVGGTYWLILAPHDAATNTAWERATERSLTVSAFRSQTSGGQFQASTGGANAFRVSATPIPEPSTWMLTTVAALPGAVGLARRRRGRAVAARQRLTSNDPEF